MRHVGVHLNGMYFGLFFFAIFGIIEASGTGRIDYEGFNDCIELRNATTRVVLAPSYGGRVLSYSWKGKSALGPAKLGPGRFDIGPEKVVPRRKELWEGEWEGGITGKYSAALVSQAHPATGVQLIREFKLDSQSSHLRVTHAIRNISDERVHWSHWSRTFGKGGGICVVPLSKYSAYPKSYVMYNDKQAIEFLPEDPQIEIRDGFFLLKGPPRFPKLGLDSHVGWLAYVTPDDLAFIKKYPTYPNRRYWEMVGMTLSLWYVDNWGEGKVSVCEIEPIGPREDIGPGEYASFTEDWYLGEFQFPDDGSDLDLNRLERVSKQLMGVDQ